MPRGRWTTLWTSSTTSRRSTRRMSRSPSSRTPWSADPFESEAVESDPVDPEDSLEPLASPDEEEPEPVRPSLRESVR